MLAASLHTRFGDYPDSCRQIDLVPSRTKDLAGARCGQDGKFKGPGCDAFALLQIF